MLYTRVYPLGDQWGLLINETVEYILDTKMEVMIMTRKLEFAESARRQITELDDLITKMNELRNIFIDSGYVASGSDPITDTDLDSLGMTKANLTAFDTFVENVNLFLSGGDPLEYNYAAAINAFRGMPT